MVSQKQDFISNHSEKKTHHMVFPAATIQQELETKATFLRHTRRKNREVYSFSAHDSEILMHYLGFLREESFRAAGGGTNKAEDVDVFDTHPTKPYKQLVVWDPETKEIIGGYRYQFMSDAPIKDDGQPFLASAQLVTFSDEFIKDYLPITTELGRSFVAKNHQARNNGPFALDNLWDGLGTIMKEYSEKKYFFGKPTLYPQHNEQSKMLIYQFMKRHFYDEKKLVSPKAGFGFNKEEDEFKKFLAAEKELETILRGSDKTLDAEFKIFANHLRKEVGEQIPPLMAKYMQLSTAMKAYERAKNPFFGDVEETAILVPIEQVKPKIIQTYTDY